MTLRLLAGDTIDLRGLLTNSVRACLRATLWGSPHLPPSPSEKGGYRTLILDPEADMLRKQNGLA